MPTDLIQRQLDVRVRAAGMSGRVALHDRMYREAAGLVWAQADRAGEMTELERARFLLRRLYPDLEGPRLEAIMATLEAEWATGTWTGFRRPTDGQPRLDRGATDRGEADRDVAARAPFAGDDDANEASNRSSR